MTRYSIQPKTRKYKQQILDTDASQNAVHKAGEFIGNKIEDAATKPNNDKIVKQELVEEIIIPPEKERKY